MLKLQMHTKSLQKEQFDLDLRHLQISISKCLENGEKPTIASGEKRAFSSGSNRNLVCNERIYGMLKKFENQKGRLAMKEKQRPRMTYSEFLKILKKVF